MGMYCIFHRISLEKLESYLENSDLLEEDFYSNEVSQIPQLDIDKAWNGILFLLTGGSLEDAENHILGKVILGSADIDKKKIIGYSSARYLLPEEVKSLNDKIKTLNTDDLKYRFDPLAMKKLEIYPNIWEDKNSFEYLQEYFMQLQSFYQHASWANEAIVISIA